jgi:predicted enzyme related to lactoylglutathione lyase
MRRRSVGTASFSGLSRIFNRPGYAEFRIGDYQHKLGIIDSKYAPGEPGTSGAILYWHVDDLDATLDRLKELGATEYEGRKERGPGFTTASVVDPFGNILGIMSNVHYLQVLGEKA